MHMDDAVIDRTVEEGARFIAFALLQQSDAAARRLAKREDEEALHDFRVGLRRLRTTLRSFRPWLFEGLGRKYEKALKRLAKGTNAAREAEVHLAFLSAQRAESSARQRAGLDFLQERLEARRGEGADVGSLLAKYERVSRKLGDRVPRYEVRLGEAPSGVTFGAALATVLGEELETVRARIAAILGPADEEHAHRARIAVKRLRYVIEPLRGNAHVDARGVVQELKRLQDVLGDLHDVHTLAHEIESALVDAAADRARRVHAAVYDGDAARSKLRDELRGGPRSGVLSLLRLVRERRDALFTELERSWRAGPLETLATEVERIAAALEARAGGKVEIERRYLLTALPPRAEAVPAVEVAVGWLSGHLVRERIRRVRASDGERYWRGIFQGESSHRFQAEEETTREVFDSLWPLSEGRRETKRRRQVSDGGVTWWIDEVSERDLVVAEARLPPHLAGDPLPDWLRPFVVRELAEPLDQAAAAEAVAAAPAESGAAVETPPNKAPASDSPAAETSAPASP